MNLESRVSNKESREFPELGNRPQIKMAEYAKRRKALFDQMENKSIYILKGANLQYRNSDAEFPFRQNSHFYYLTGFNEPDAVLVLIKEGNNEEYILFCREKKKEEEIWTGPRVGVEGAKEKFQATTSFAISELDAKMPILLENKEKIGYSLGHSKEFDEKMVNWVNQVRSKVRKGTHAPETWFDFVHMISAMRLHKSPDEVQQIKEACRISAEGHAHLMRICRAGKWEYQLEGEFINYCFQSGLRFMAYSPIVAGGSNACTLHYIQNSDQLKDGDLLLVDAGAECENYAADITRTFPVNGKFTEAQKAIYELVLEAQEAAIKAAKPGVAWHKLQEIMVEILVTGLVKLNILQGDVQELIKEKKYRQFYMHSSGHWLGLDVHDAGEYKINENWRPLEAQMVFTIEPGLYFDPNQEGLDSKWKGIGVRIEDDILITKDGCEVLTKMVPKRVEEIEALMRGGRG